MKKIVFALSIFAMTTTASAGSPWALNDVTILYPLGLEMIGFTDATSGVTYIDRKVLFDDGHIYSPAGANPDLPGVSITDQFRVVGVRFDPCFRDVAKDICRHQIRFSWQPVVFFRGKWTALDEGLHSFYDLDESSWKAMVNEIDTLRKPYSYLTVGKPLQVHPALAREGLNGKFALGLRKILGKYAGSLRPTRVTHMNAIGVLPADGAPSNIWDFRIAELDSQGRYFFKQNPLVVKSGVFGETGFESLRNGSLDGKEFDSALPILGEDGYVVATLTPGIENILLLLKDSIGFLTRADRTELLNTYRSVLRIEQPAFHQAMTTDCVSCHTSTSAKGWFSRNLSSSELAIVERPFRQIWAASKHDLSNVSSDLGHTRSVRALGYVRAAPAISNRVIYESATVADEMSKTK